MRKLIENLLYFSRPLLRVLIRRPIIIFPFDGGTCSQINDYLCLKYCENNYKNIKAYADISWYERYKEPMDSTIARPYNFENLFESLELKKATRFQVWFYKLCFYYSPLVEDMKNGFNADISQIKIPKGPVYLGGYYYLPPILLKECVETYLHFKAPETFLDKNSMELYNEISMNDGLTVGVHVRRGDMAIEGGYWKVVPKEYYINVTKIPELENSIFYFFSEEPEWIEENILPDITVTAKVVKSNPAYYGYRDLFLLSTCKYQVRSHGSFGQYAYYLNKYKDKKMIEFDENNNALWKWLE